MVAFGIQISNKEIVAERRLILELYEKVSTFNITPNIYDVYGQYCSVVDKRLSDLQESFYLDEYDKSSGNLPDYIVDDLTDHIGISMDLTIESIAKILESENLFFVAGVHKNNPLQEVW